MIHLKLGFLAFIWILMFLFYFDVLEFVRNTIWIKLDYAGIVALAAITFIIFYNHKDKSRFFVAKFIVYTIETVHIAKLIYLLYVVNYFRHMLKDKDFNQIATKTALVIALYSFFSRLVLLCLVLSFHFVLYLLERECGERVILVE